MDHLAGRGSLPHAPMSLELWWSHFYPKDICSLKRSLLFILRLSSLALVHFRLTLVSPCSRPVVSFGNSRATFLHMLTVHFAVGTFTSIEAHVEGGLLVLCLAGVRLGGCAPSELLLPDESVFVRTLIVFELILSLYCLSCCVR